MWDLVTSHFSALNGGYVDVVAKSLRAIEPIASAAKGKGSNGRVAVGFFMAKLAASSAVRSSAVSSDIGLLNAWSWS